MLRRTLSAALLLGLFLHARGIAGAASLSLQSTVATLLPGATATINLKLDVPSGPAPSALQWTLQYPLTALNLVGISLGPAASAAGKTLVCSSTLSASTCVLTGNNVNTMATGVVATVSIAATAVLSGTPVISLANFVAASAVGDNVALTGAGIQFGTGSTGGTSGGPVSAPCSYSLAASSTSVAAAGSAGSVTLTTSSACTWQAQSAASWITLSAATNGTGSTAITYQVAANTGAARSGTLTIAGLMYRVDQAAGTVTESPVPAPSGVMPHFVYGGPWKTTITLINTGTAAVTARLGYFDNSGAAAQVKSVFPETGAVQTGVSVTRTVPAGGVALIETASAATPAEGWVQIDGAVQGFAVLKNSVTNQEAAVPFETAGTEVRTLGFDNTGTLNTGFSIVNMTSGTIDVPLIVRTLSGGILTGGSIRLSPRARSSIALRTGYPLTVNQRGTLQLYPTAGVRFAVIGWRNNGIGTTTLPAMTSGTGEGGGSLAHLIYGGGWKTGLLLTNLTPSATAVATRWYASNGSALNLPLRNLANGVLAPANGLNQSVAASASLAYDIGPVDAAVPNMGLGELTGPNVGGLALFTHTVSGRETAAAMESRNARSYVLAFDTITAPILQIAVANLSSFAAEVPITIRNADGSVLSTSTIRIPVDGRAFFSLVAAYPVTGGKRGAIEFGTPLNGRIGVLGLRGVNETTMAAIPVMVKP